MNKRRPPSSAQTSSPSKKQASILDWIKGTSSGGDNGDDENEPSTPANRGDAIIGDQRDEDCPICAASLTKLAAEERQRHVNRCLDAVEDADEDAPDYEVAQEFQAASASAALTIVNDWKSIFAQAKMRVGRALGYGFASSSDTATVAIVTSTVAIEAAATTTSSSSGSISSGKSAQPTRPCPFYKRIPGTAFVVDAFSYGAIPGVTAYFLSHFHSDHYMGLSKSFKHGTIYCSSITANLVIKELRVDPKYIVRLPMDETVPVENALVTLIDANHCPGSVLFHIYVQHPNVPSAFSKIPQPMSILHTGDFRAHPLHLQNRILREYPNVPVDILYLDTTYCKPTYCFPSQDQAIAAVVDICRRERVAASLPNDEPADANLRIEPSQQSSVLFLVGTYTIGKERVFTGIAKALDCLIFTTKRKRKILECQESSELAASLTDDPNATCLHVVGMGDLTIPKLELYLSCYQPQVERIVAFRPTGWSFSKRTDINALQPHQKSQDGKITIYGVPYSEHSSYDELASFVKGLKPKHIIPTVNNGTERSRADMQKHFTKWLSDSSS